MPPPNANLTMCPETPDWMIREASVFYFVTEKRTHATIDE